MPCDGETVWKAKRHPSGRGASKHPAKQPRGVGASKTGEEKRLGGGAVLAVVTSKSRRSSPCPERFRTCIRSRIVIQSIVIGTGARSSARRQGWCEARRRLHICLSSPIEITATGGCRRIL